MLRRLSTSLSILAAAFVVAAIPALAEDAAVPSTELVTPAQLPSWMSATVIKSAVDIQMTDAQQHEFNDVVAEFVSGHFAMIQKELKREAPDLEQRVRSRDGVLIRQMDTHMRSILTTEQWPAYESYKKVLRSELKTAPLPQGSEGTRTSHGIGGGQG